MSNLETTGKEVMGLLVEDSILDLEKVVEAIKWELKNALNWTTLECDWWCLYRNTLQVIVFFG